MLEHSYILHLQKFIPFLFHMMAEHSSDFLPESSSMPQTFSRFVEVFHLHPCHIDKYFIATSFSLNFCGLLSRELQEF